MPVNKFLKSKYWKIALISIAIIGLTMPALTQAGFVVNAAEDAGKAILAALMEGIGWLFYGIFYLLNLIILEILALVGKLVDLAIELNYGVSNSPAVQEGWRLSRNFANSLFVLAIIIMAFATILRIQKYGVKEALWKLIVLALLINFSLLIANFFLDFSNVAAKTFLTTEGGSVSAALASTLRLQDLIRPAIIIGEKMGPVDILEAGLKHIVGLGLMTIFNIIATIVLAAIGLMFVIRYFYMSILLILMPAAWSLWLFPDLHELGKKWWSKFLQWTLFFPIVGFFFYLAMFVGINRKGAVWNDEIKRLFPTVAGDDGFSWQSALGLVLGCGLLVGGLIAGQAAGFGAAATGLAWAKGFKNWSLGAISKGTKGAGRLGLNQALRAGATAEKPSYAQRAANKFAGVPLLKGVSSKLSNYLAQGEKDVEDYSKANLDDLTDDALLKRADGPIVNPVEKAGVATRLAKRNLTEKIKEPRLKALLSGAIKMGVSKPILAYRPDLAKEFGLTVEKVRAGHRPKDVENYATAALGNFDVVKTLANPDLEKLGKEGSPEQKEAAMKVINDAIANIQNLTPEDQTKIQRISDFTFKSSAWKK